MRKVLLMVMFLLLPTICNAQGWVRAQWNMNPPAEVVQYYQAVLDGGTPQTIYSPGPNCNPAGNFCFADFEIKDNLNHIISVVAKNQFGFGPATQASFQFGVPSAPQNLTLTNLFPPASNTASPGFSSVTPLNTTPRAPNPEPQPPSLPSAPKTR